jgi:hypothetical protein
LASIIAEKWELDEEDVNLIKEVECEKCENNEISKIAAAVHLELFRIVSKPQFYILNSFVDFNPETIKIATKNYERMLNEQ